MPRAAAKKTKPVVGACLFCNCTEDQEEKWGKKITKNGITVHYFCMLFSSGLSQNGDEDVGIQGFMTKDIFKEISRGRRLRCGFCKKTGATIGCVNSICRMSFHYGCGSANTVLYQYFGNFSSYCGDHRPKQNEVPGDALLPAKVACAICMCLVKPKPSNDTLRTPCCKNAWYHRDCIQRMATASGMHFFKCPLCNNKDRFQEEMQTFGIHIPDQDAAWELEPNAFQELLERHSCCDVPGCQCPKGKKFHRNSGKWEIVLCDYCGSQGCHLVCGGLKTPADDWICLDCRKIVPEDNKQQKGKKSKEKKKSPDAAQTDIANWLEKKIHSEYPGKTPQGRGYKRKASSTPGGKPAKRTCTSVHRGKISPQQGPSTSLVDNEAKHSTSKNKTKYQKPKGKTLKGGKKSNASSTEMQTTRKSTSPPKKTPVAKKSTTKASMGGKQFYSKGKENSLSSCGPSASMAVDRQVTSSAQPIRRRGWLKRNSVDDEELLQLDFSKRPRWLQKLMEEDILTGANVGSKLSGFNMEPCEGSSCNKVVKDAKNIKQPLWLRQTLMEDYLTGRNLGAKLAVLSPALGKFSRSRSLGDLNHASSSSGLHVDTPRRPSAGSCHEKQFLNSHWRKRRARSHDTEDQFRSSFYIHTNLHDDELKWTKMEPWEKDDLLSFEKKNLELVSVQPFNLTYNEFLDRHKVELDEAALAEGNGAGGYLWRLHKYQEYLENRSQEGNFISESSDSKNTSSVRLENNIVVLSAKEHGDIKGLSSVSQVLPSEPRNKSSWNCMSNFTVTSPEVIDLDSNEDPNDLIVVSESIVTPPMRLKCRCGKKNCAIMSRTNFNRQTWASPEISADSRKGSGHSANSQKQLSSIAYSELRNHTSISPRKVLNGAVRNPISTSPGKVPPATNTLQSPFHTTLPINVKHKTQRLPAGSGQNMKKLVCTCRRKTAPTLNQTIDLTAGTCTEEVVDLTEEECWSELRQYQEEANKSFLTDISPSKTASTGHSSPSPINSASNEAYIDLDEFYENESKLTKYPTTPNSGNNVNNKLSWEGTPGSARKNKLKLNKGFGQPRALYEEGGCVSSTTSSQCSNPSDVFSEPLIKPSAAVGAAPRPVGSPRHVSRSPKKQSTPQNMGMPSSTGWAHDQHPAYDSAGGFYGVNLRPDSWTSNRDYNSQQESGSPRTKACQGQIQPGYRELVQSDAFSRPADCDSYNSSFSPEGMISWSPSASRPMYDQGGTTVTVRSPAHLNTQMHVNLAGEPMQTNRERPGNVTININMTQDQIINID